MFCKYFLTCRIFYSQIKKIRSNLSISLLSFVHWVLNNNLLYSLQVLKFHILHPGICYMSDSVLVKICVECVCNALSTPLVSCYGDLVVIVPVTRVSFMHRVYLCSVELEWFLKTVFGQWHAWFLWHLSIATVKFIQEAINA